LIDSAIKESLYRYLRQRCVNTPGVFIHSIGGIADHVHIAVSVPPTLTIAEWIGEVKGASAHYINHELGVKALQWQAGYGVVSFGKKNLPYIKEYIERQEEHHAAGKGQDRLERIEAVEREGG
jgi:putative transposase